MNGATTISDVNTTFVTLPIVTWDQYFNGIIRERAKSTIEEYNRHEGYSDQNGDDPFLPEDPSTVDDSTYTRNIVRVEELYNPSKVARKQFDQQLSDADVLYTHFGENFETAVERACVEAMNNFCEIENSVLVKLGGGHYVLAPITRDDIVLKLLDFTQGAIVIYRPKMFVRFTAEDIDAQSSDN